MALDEAVAVDATALVDLADENWAPARRRVPEHGRGGQRGALIHQPVDRGPSFAVIIPRSRQEAFVAERDSLTVDDFEVTPKFVDVTFNGCTLMVPNWPSTTEGASVVVVNRA